ncbi:collagen-binding domain-containing protein [Luteimicrobium subarcticum]|uniref:collagen-binding domain-containing protein n=1 Tax=Luteimicrobium subarcticum TaxID=620910 RepID=UPI0012FE4684|nr:collagen-binding domain-containing protein [Luteimicrobium subarcticum]
MRSFPSVVRVLLPTAGAALVVPLVIGAVASSAGAATTVCPVLDTGGFTVLVQDDMTFGNAETEGSIGVGGDLTLSGAHALIHTSGLTPPGYDLPVVDGDPTRLLVGGTLVQSSTGTLKVTSRDDVTGADDHVGAVKMGDTTGLSLAARSDLDRLYVTDRGQDPAPWIDVDPAAGQTLDGDHAVTDPGAASVVTDLFPALLAQGRALQDGTGTDTAAGTATLAADGDRGVVTLTPGVVNVLRVSAADLDASTSLQFAGTTPSADTPFVVDVTGPDDLSVRIPPLRGEAMPGQPDADHPNPWAPYVTWNLTGARSAVVTGDLVTGSVLAPDVDLTLDANSPVEGQVVAKALVTAGGEIHTYLSAADCRPAPSPTDSTTTPATPTDSPTVTPTPPVTPTVTPTPTGSSTTTAPVTPTSTDTDLPLVVPTASAGTGTPGTGEGSDGGSSGGLAETGASLAPLGVGAVLVAAGAVLLVVRRRIATR